MGKLEKILIGILAVTSAVVSQKSFMIRAEQEESPGYACWRTIDGLLYRIDSVAQQSIKPYHIPDAQLDIGTSEDPNIVSGDIYVNFCGGVKGSRFSNCDADLTSTGYFLYNNGQDCLSLSTSRDKRAGEKVDPVHTKWSYEQIDHANGLVIIGNNSKILDNTVTKKDLHLRFICSHKVNAPKDENLKSIFKDNILTISIESSFNCGQNVFGPAGDIIRMGWPLALIGIVFGLILIPFGSKIFKASVSILAFGIAFMMMYAFFQLAWAKMDPKIKFYVVIGFSIALGIIAAYFMYTNEKSAFVISGIILGCILGTIIYTSAGLYKFETNGENLILWLTMVGTGILSGTISYFLHDHAIIFGTAFGGAYMLMRSIGSMVGNYPNEFEIAEKFKDGNEHTIPVAFWVYFGFMVLFAIVGVVYQYTKRTDEIDVDELAQDGYTDYESLNGSMHK